MYFYPILTAVYIQKRRILQTIYVLNQKILHKNPWFIIKSGFKSKAGYNGVRTVYGAIIVEFFNDPEQLFIPIVTVVVDHKTDRTEPAPWSLYSYAQNSNPEG